MAKMKKKSRLIQAQEASKASLDSVNVDIEKLGVASSILFSTIGNLEEIIDNIKGFPEEKVLQYRNAKHQISSWKQQAERIEASYNGTMQMALANGAAGVGAGVAVMSIGPSAAMGIATTFGVASTGTPIAALSGVAFQNAALAWLGGGALAVGGGGMKAGAVFLALAGPVGVTIAALSAVAAGAIFVHSFREKGRIESIFTLISKRDVLKYQLADAEILQRVQLIIDEAKQLENLYGEIKDYGTDYSVMNEKQQYRLGTCVNLLLLASEHLTTPINGLLPKYREEDFTRYCSWPLRIILDEEREKYGPMILSLSNYLDDIPLTEKDQKLVHKTLKQNKEFLAKYGITKKEFTLHIVETASDALNYQRLLKEAK